jgi:hypothetical protein
VSKRKTKQIIIVITIANAIYPTPVAIPTAIAKNMKLISFELPGTDLNLTRLKAPITATPVPRLPFTNIITICTKAGIIASVITKFFEKLLFDIYVSDIVKPDKIDIIKHINAFDAESVPDAVSKILVNIYCSSSHY